MIVKEFVWSALPRDPHRIIKSKSPINVFQATCWYAKYSPSGPTKKPKVQISHQCSPAAPKQVMSNACQIPVTAFQTIFLHFRKHAQRCKIIKISIFNILRFGQNHIQTCTTMATLMTNCTKHVLKRIVADMPPILFPSSFQETLTMHPRTCKYDNVHMILENLCASCCVTFAWSIPDKAWFREHWWAIPTL